MLNQIKALLQDGQLRQKIKEAKTLDEAVKLITTADAEKGGNFTTEDVTQMLTKLASGSGNELIELSEQDLLELSEQDLLAVAGPPIPSYNRTISIILLCPTVPPLCP